jgi:hypothetical protein
MLIRSSLHSHTDPKLPNFGPTLPVKQCEGAPISPSKAYEGAQTLLYIQYGCDMQLEGAYSLNHDTTTSFGLPFTPIFQNLRSHHLHRYNSVRMHPCALPQHTKMDKHFIYIQYGCGIKLAGVSSLNHDTTTSLGLRLTPIFQNLALTITGITV